MSRPLHDSSAMRGLMRRRPQLAAVPPSSLQPSCFASRPAPQQRAENGCDDCPLERQCDQAGDRDPHYGFDEMERRNVPHLRNSLQFEDRDAALTAWLAQFLGHVGYPTRLEFIMARAGQPMRPSWEAREVRRGKRA